MIIDTSALLAVVFKEQHGLWVTKRLEDNAGHLLMSTVNLTEALIRVLSRQREFFEDARNDILSGSIRFIPPTVEQSEVAARARMRFPLNLGDCFAYALAKEENDAILTLDTDFGQTDVSVILPPPD